MEHQRTITGIVGLPASGKTFLAKEMVKNKTTILIDDPINWFEIVSLLENNPQFDVVITDPYFCYDPSRERAEKKLKPLGYNVEWIFFENDPNQCQINALNRPTKAVKELINVLTKVYNIPSDAKPIPVWKPKV